MKKYKLIKEYPGSPKLGYIIDISNITTEKFTWFEQNLFSYENIQRYHQVKDVTNHPEFWQEVIEVQKEYEILSFLTTSKHGVGGKKISNLKLNNLFNFDNETIGNCTLESMLNSLDTNLNVIHSIKRLSDGENN